MTGATTTRQTLGGWGRRTKRLGISDPCLLATTHSIRCPSSYINGEYRRGTDPNTAPERNSGHGWKTMQKRSMKTEDEAKRMGAVWRKSE